jgi:hypothetical protein
LNASDCFGTSRRRLYKNRIRDRPEIEKSNGFD